MDSLLLAMIGGLYLYDYSGFALISLLTMLFLGMAQINYITLLFLYNAIIYYYHGLYGIICALLIICIYIGIGIVFWLDISSSDINREFNKFTRTLQNDRSGDPNKFSYPCSIFSLFKKVKIIKLITNNIDQSYNYICNKFDDILMYILIYVSIFRTMTNKFTGFKLIYDTYDKFALTVSRLYETIVSFKLLFRFSKMINNQTNNISIPSKSVGLNKAFDEIKALEELEAIADLDSVDEIDESISLTDPILLTEINALDKSSSLTEPMSLAEIKSLTEPMYLAEIKSLTDPISLAEIKSLTEPMYLAEIKSLTEPMSLAEIKSLTEPMYLAEIKSLTDPISLVEVREIDDLDELDDMDSLDEIHPINKSREIITNNDSLNIDLFGDIFNGIGGAGMPDIKQIMEMESTLTDEQKKQRSKMADQMMESIFGKNNNGTDFKKLFAEFDGILMNKKKL